MVEKNITYFERAGSANTEETVKIARERAAELGIRDIVVASSHGETALKVAETFKDLDVNVVAVTICESFRDQGWTMTEKERENIQAKGVKVLTGVHALGDDVGFAFTDKFGGATVNRAVRQTLYRFCQGMKVCVEIVLMAADAGLIPVDREVIA
ncbi:MAG: hypothetical protein NWF14_09575, partial [Candidatus Bathyarchaeota archaeon]|nr:hypothetical protein [Candidatus Bathyarchaeota archaeon]